jgi:hypothetical protein
LGEEKEQQQKELEDLREPPRSLWTWWTHKKMAKQASSPCWSDFSERCRRSSISSLKAPVACVVCQPCSFLCKILLARGSTRGVCTGCGCRVLWRTIQRVPPRSPTCSRIDSKKCTARLRCKNKYSFACI